MINSEKLKIMLTREDMTKYDIQLYSKAHTVSAIKETFSSVLTEIKERTGFDTLSQSSVLQVYPSRDGGCEIYITRNDDDVTRYPSAPNAAAAREDILRLERKIFVFDDILALTDACALLKSRGYSGLGALYAYNNEYYLLLEARARAYRIKSELMPLFDFGRCVEGPFEEAYIIEHGECIIADRAVEALSLD